MAAATRTLRPTRTASPSRMRAFGTRCSVQPPVTASDLSFSAASMARPGGRVRVTALSTARGFGGVWAHPTPDRGRCEEQGGADDDAPRHARTQSGHEEREAAQPKAQSEARSCTDVTCPSLGGGRARGRRGRSWPSGRRTRRRTRCGQCSHRTDAPRSARTSPIALRPQPITSRLRGDDALAGWPLAVAGRTDQAQQLDRDREDQRGVFLGRDFHHRRQHA